MPHVKKFNALQKAAFEVDALFYRKECIEAQNKVNEIESSNVITLQEAMTKCAEECSAALTLAYTIAHAAGYTGTRKTFNDEWNAIC